MRHFIFTYSPLPSDDWLYAVVYFDGTDVEASSWLFIYNTEAI